MRSLLQDDDVMMERCASEYTACTGDIDCSACYDDMVANESCSEIEDVTTCAGVADHFCCLAGEACGDNDLLVALVSEWNETATFSTWSKLFAVGSNLISGWCAGMVFVPLAWTSIRIVRTGGCRRHPMDAQTVRETKWSASNT